MPFRRGRDIDAVLRHRRGQSATRPATSVALFIAGFGPGYAPYEFDLYGIPLDERHDRHREGTEVVMKVWCEEEFSHHGKYYDFDNVSVLPKPCQRPHPPIAIAAG